MVVAYLKHNSKEGANRAQVLCQLHLVGGRGGETVSLTLKLIKWGRSIGLPTLTWRDQKNGRDKPGVIIPAKDNEDFSRDAMFLYANSGLMNLYNDKGPAAYVRKRVFSHLECADQVASKVLVYVQDLAGGSTSVTFGPLKVSDLDNGRRTPATAFAGGANLDMKGLGVRREDRRHVLGYASGGRTPDGLDFYEGITVEDVLLGACSRPCCVALFLSPSSPLFISLSLSLLLGTRTNDT